MIVHGDDMVALGAEESLNWVKKKLEELGLHFGMQVPEGWQDA